MEPAPDIRYIRLTRFGARGGFSLAFRSRTSLWLGPDHLLSVESNSFTESYKRFYFRDIQAVIVQKTRSFQTVNLVVGIIALALLLLTVILMPKSRTGWDSNAVGGGIFLGFLTALFLVILILNFIGGPTCKTFLRTAVQIEQMPSLHRVWAARRFASKIHPLVVAAQGGELSPEAIEARLREWSQPVPENANPPGESPNAPPRLSS